MDECMKPLTYAHHRYAVHNSGPKCTQILILKPEKLKTHNKSLMVKVHTV